MSQISCFWMYVTVTSGNMSYIIFNGTSISCWILCTFTFCIFFPTSRHHIQSKAYDRRHSILFEVHNTNSSQSFIIPPPVQDLHLLSWHLLCASFTFSLSHERLGYFSILFYPSFGRCENRQRKGQSICRWQFPQNCHDENGISPISPL